MYTCSLVISSCMKYTCACFKITFPTSHSMATSWGERGGGGSTGVP